MIRLAFLLTALTLAAGAAHAQWTVDETGRAATVCPVDGGGARLCLTLGCDADGTLGWALGHARDADLTAAPGAQAVLSVGSRLVGDLEFAAVAPNRLEAPLTRSQTDGFEWLKRGVRAELKLRTGADAAWRSVAVDLTGSRRAIDAVQAACALPDFVARERERRIAQDPRASVLDSAAEACALLGGTVQEQGGLVREIDLDGKGGADLVVYHPAAQCSAAPTAACGPDGCLQSIWIAQEDGQYRQVLAQNLYGLALMAPGEVAVDVSARQCGRAAASACRKRFVLGEDVLEDRGEISAQR